MALIQTFDGFKNEPEIFYLSHLAKYRVGVSVNKMEEVIEEVMFLPYSCFEIIKIEDINKSKNLYKKILQN